MLIADLTENAGIVMIPLLLACGLFAFILAAAATITGSEDRRVRSGHWLLAIVLGVSVIWLAFYAAGEDTYYGGGVSRWEHADRFMGTFPVSFAVGFGALTAAALVLSALSPERRALRLLVGPGAALSCVALLLAWFALTAGH